MLPDLGRLIRLGYVLAALTIALRLALGRWRSALIALAGLAGLAVAARRQLASKRPLAPADWPPAGSPQLALGTGSGVWRVHLPSGQTFPASPAREPIVALTVEHDRLRAQTRDGWAETTDWRGWTRGWRTAPRTTRVVAGWRRPTIEPALASALQGAGLPRRLQWVTAVLPDANGGHYVACAPLAAELALRTDVAVPLLERFWLGSAASALAQLADQLLARRVGRLYHLDSAGTRRLIASELPPLLAIGALPTDGPLAAPPAPIVIRPIPTGPEPLVVEAGH